MFLPAPLRDREEKRSNQIAEAASLVNIKMLLSSILNEEEKKIFNSYFQKYLDSVFLLKRPSRFDLSQIVHRKLVNRGFDPKLDWKQDFDMEDSEEFNNYIPQVRSNLWRYFWDFLKLTFPKVEKRYLLLLLWNIDVQRIFNNYRLWDGNFRELYCQIFYEKVKEREYLIKYIQSPETADKPWAAQGLVLNLINSFDKDKNWEIYELRKDHPWKDKLMFEPRILQASTYGFLAELLKSEVMNLKLGNKTLRGILFP